MSYFFRFSGTVRVWHANTYRLENTLNYGMERVWAVATLRGSNDVALGYDEGAIVIKVCLPSSFFSFLLFGPSLSVQDTISASAPSLVARNLQ